MIAGSSTVLTFELLLSKHGQYVLYCMHSLLPVVGLKIWNVDGVTESPHSVLCLLLHSATETSPSVALGPIHPKKKGGLSWT